MTTTQKNASIIGLSLIVATAAFAAYGLANGPAKKPDNIVAPVEGSGPDARIAANLLSPDAPVRGPFRTEELKHIKLTDQDGKIFSLDELKGETLLVNFIFAGCISICPVQTAGLRRVHNEMKLDPEKDSIKFLSVSIAPLSDTPKQLKAFAKRYEIDKPSWRFAMTNQAHTDELSEQFGVGVKPLEGDQLDHRSLLYLINHEGIMIQQYKGNVVDVERLKNELRVVDQMGRS